MKRKFSLPFFLSVSLHLLFLSLCVLVFFLRTSEINPTEHPSKKNRTEVEMALYGTRDKHEPSKPSSRRGIKENETELSAEKNIQGNSLGQIQDLGSDTEGRSLPVIQNHPGSPGDGSPDPSSETSRYLAEIRQQIENQLEIPESLQRHGPRGQVILRVMIQPSGALALSEILQSSGSAELDQAALRAVQGAAPFTPFEQRLGSRSMLRFQLPLIFK